MRVALLAAAVACSGCNKLLGIEPLHLGDDDASSDPVDAPFVYGQTALFSYEVGNAPTTPVTLAADIDTDTDPRCDAHVALHCVIAGSTIAIADGTIIVATGSRPLALVAADTVDLAGTLDASSTIAGQLGANTQPMGQCLGQVAAAANNGNGGGGAGGSFGAVGALGGGGNNNVNTGGKPGPAEVPVASIRGGCKGGDGFQGGGDPTPGAAGGGALVIVAGTKIQVESTGRVFASGAGGKGGQTQAGGAGGGSGGMIGLDAPMLILDGRIAANGGGGGEGSTNGSQGNNGVDGAKESVDTPGAGGSGGSGNAGDGGAGATGGNAPVNGQTTNNGGGGGGGAVGLFWIHGTITSGTVFSPTPTTI